MIKNFRLSNGMRVTMEQMAGYRSAALGIWVKVGSVNETARENGMAHAIEHMVFKGTKRRTARELADDMTENGDNLEAYTTKEYTCFYARTISEHLPKAIDILSDMLTNSLFDEDDLQRELRVIAEEIDMYDDAPEDIVHERLQEAIWRGHPLGFLISGDKPTIQNFRREDILTFMEKYYTASRMILTVSGAFDETQTLKQLEAAFGNVPVGETGMDNAEITMAPYQSALYCKHKDVEQVHINLGFESIAYHDSKRYVCSVVNNLLGGNVNSRLFQSVREEQGLAYTIYSYGNAYEKGGLFHIYAATQPEQVEAVLKSVLHIIEELKELPVTER